MPGQSAYPARRNKIFRDANTQAYARIGIDQDQAATQANTVAAQSRSPSAVSCAMRWRSRSVAGSRSAPHYGGMAVASRGRITVNDNSLAAQSALVSPSSGSALIPR